jgi:hypothetical protein
MNEVERGGEDEIAPTVRMDEWWNYRIQVVVEFQGFLWGPSKMCYVILLAEKRRVLSRIGRGCTPYSPEH